MQNATPLKSIVGSSGINHLLFPVFGLENIIDGWNQSMANMCPLFVLVPCQHAFLQRVTRFQIKVTSIMETMEIPFLPERLHNLAKKYT